MTSLCRCLAVPAALLALAAAFTWSDWSAPVQWTPDGLFYEAQAHELTGTPAAAARQQVFFGPLGRSVSDSTRRLQDRRWIAFAAPFYRRRWVVPALSDVVRPLFGSRALLIVSLLGYAACGLLAYALARRRFGVLPAAAAGAFVLWYPPLREWAAYPLTDSMGVATLFLALLAANWSLSGRRIRVAGWAASVLLVSFTRDTAVIAVGAALMLAVVRRTRRAALVAAAGVAAALPAPLLFGAPLRTTLAFTFSGNRIPAQDSWSFVFDRYGAFVHWMLATDFPFASSGRITFVLLLLVALLALRPASTSQVRRVWALAVAFATAFIAFSATLVGPLQLFAFDVLPMGILLVVAVLPLFLAAPGRDPFFAAARGGALASIAYLFVLPQYTDLRLALVVLPFAALGAARAVELVREAVPQRGVNDATSIPKYVGAS